MDVAVIGAGMGGLAAAIALARAGRRVTVFEARDRVGGLAGRVDLAGRGYDGGPYILLDRPGLEWVCAELGADLDELELLPLPEVYRVHRPDGPTVAIHHDLQLTADTLEATWPGAGDRYRRFIAHMGAVYDDLVPLQRRGRPGVRALIRTRALHRAPFLLRGLAAHLRGSGLPDVVQDALGIWTHIAGQPLSQAPAPLAFVPAVIHSRGAWVVRGGVWRIGELLAKTARDLGVQIRLGTRVDRIVRAGRRVIGVEVDGERIEATAVISNAPGIATYTTLLQPPDEALSRQLADLPLQSPGVAAYLSVNAAPTVPFLQFWLPPDGSPCRLLVHPGAVDDTRIGHARLVAPMRHSRATALGADGQAAFLDEVLAETWWRDGLDEVEVLARRIPVEWGQRYHLWRDSMNPAMTARFMRRGRLPHRSPVADNLFLCGSATHPGQWVSFCAISGTLAARALLEG